jgi:hypothetical protein
MLHACFTTIGLCFIYTSWRFYAFSGTNLLTRCHSASSCFLLFLYFREVIQEILLELDETKPEVPIFPDMKMESKAEMEEGTKVATPPGGAGTPWSRQAMVWGPWVPSDMTLPPINCLQHENPKGRGLDPQKVSQHCRHRRPVSGDRSLYSGTLPGRGIAPGAISIDSTTIFIAVADSHDEEGLVLPRR